MSPRPLEELIEISHQIGRDPDLVQGGGGNTSVKSRDGKRLFIKASGTALGDMAATKGWCELGLDDARAILHHRGLARLSPKKRERKVLELLQGGVKRPRGARPSVETSLHALLDRVVIHTHPVGLNALLCSRDSRRRYRDLVPDRLGEPLYIPYVDPGFVLATRAEAEIAAYRARRGRAPGVVLLENHGLFVAADEVDVALKMSRTITRAGSRLVGGRVNPFRFAARPRKIASAVDIEIVSEALLAAGIEPGSLRPDTSETARRFLRSRSVEMVRRGAFTPDQIVYCRTHPVYLRRPSSGWKSREETRRGLGKALKAYVDRHKLDPRVIVLDGAGIFYRAPDLGQLRIVSEVYRSALTTMLHGRRLGGPRFLSRRQAAFIEGWEVEAFRANLVREKQTEE